MDIRFTPRLLGSGGKHGAGGLTIDAVDVATRDEFSSGLSPFSLATVDPSPDIEDNDVSTGRVSFFKFSKNGKFRFFFRTARAPFPRPKRAARRR